MMKSLFEQSLIGLFRHSSQVFFIITDIKGHLLYANPLFGKRSGFTVDRLPALSIREIIAKDDINQCFSAIEKCLEKAGRPATTGPLGLRHPGYPSKICWELSLAGNGADEPERIQWVGIEEPAGDKLRQSELFYRNLIADSLDGILLTSTEGIISFASASVKKIVGYEPEELLTKNAFEFLHPDDRASGAAAFFEEVKKTPGSKFINARIKQKSGEWLWCMIRGHNLLSNPHVGAMLIYFCDDTARINAEAALVESEQRFRHLIHNLKLGVLLLNEKGQVLICNEPAYELFGLTEKDLVGVAILDLDWDIIRDDGTGFPRDDYPISIALRTRKAVRDIVMGVHKAGTTERVWVLVNAEVVTDSNDNILHVICSFTDITEQRRLAQQLIDQEIQKQKMLLRATIDGQEKERSEIGRELHDNISQHLTTTRLYLEVAKEKASGELLKMINQAHKGLMDMVNEIRQLSQSLVPPSLNDIGLVASVKDLCNPLKNTHAFDIDFQYSDFNDALLSDNMKLMLFRIIQEQVNNIIRHAQASSIKIDLQTGEGKVMLSITDNGKGFDPKSIKKGLGFNNMNNRAGLFGGTIRIDSAPGKGCTVQVTIPL
ncbi:MAG: PAS domain S-box protein [Bacteroidota bacterium]|nr:PAS domain S-box protein [Bacteroidota bacterium]